MNDDLRKSEDERAPEQKMISKHRSTNWVRTRDKCGIAALGMKAWEEVEKWCGTEASPAEQGFAVSHEFVGRNHESAAWTRWKCCIRILPSRLLFNPTPLE